MGVLLAQLAGAEGQAAVEPAAAGLKPALLVGDRRAHQAPLRQLRPPGRPVSGLSSHTQPSQPSAARVSRALLQPLPKPSPSPPLSRRIGSAGAPAWAAAACRGGSRTGSDAGALSTTSQALG